MQGRPTLSTATLEAERFQTDCLDNAATAVLRYSPGHRMSQPRLLRIIEAVGHILDSDLHLGHEPVVTKTSSGGFTPVACVEGTQSGLSRDPFRSVASAHDRNLIAVAAVCHLARAHALLFCRIKRARDYNVAKTALNDCHQAYQLAWRLHNDGAPLAQGHASLAAALDADVASATADVGPPSAISPYFVWSVFTLCDVFRGNTYRHIEFLRDAERCYRRAQRRFHQLRRLLTPTTTNPDDPHHLSHFATPTFIRGMFEYSKVKFDLGQFLESLLLQVTCLDHLIASAPPPDAGAAAATLAQLRDIARLLDNERSAPIFDRDRITTLFGDPCVRTKSTFPHIPIAPLTPLAIAPFLTRAQAEIAVPLFARMGFTLYSIRSKWRALHTWKDETAKNAAERTAHASWLRSFFRFDRVWSDVTPSLAALPPSPVGRYCETLFPDLTRRDRPHTQREPRHNFRDLERRLALRLRRVAGTPQFEGTLLSSNGYYSTILSTATQNLRNIVTIPRRNRKFLMRRGYRYRRTDGDLSKASVYESVRSALRAEGRLPRDTNEGPAAPTLSGATNKLVVLRRWQSYNPKVPRPTNERLRGGGYFLCWQNKGIVIDPGYDFIQSFYDEGFSLEDIDAVLISHSHPDHDDDFPSLTTLVKEWNEYHERMHGDLLTKRLDLFLNDSAHLKFAAWLQASGVKIGRVIPLPVLFWNKEPTNPNSAESIRGNNVILDLSRQDSKVPPEAAGLYHMKIEIVPAWHDDVISKSAAVGFKFHLLSPDGIHVGVVGYTGDTRAYGLDIAEPDADPEPWHLISQYADCDVLIAHLGDVRLRELASVMQWDERGDGSPFSAVLRGWFGSDPAGLGPDVFRDLCGDFIDFLIGLDIAPSEAFRALVPTADGHMRPIQKYIADLLKGVEWTAESRPTHLYGDGWKRVIAPMTEPDHPDYAARSRAASAFWDGMKHARDVWKLDENRLGGYLLLEYLCSWAIVPWQYPYHLGILGTYRLFQGVAAHRAGVDRAKAVFIVGELPEELASYRHLVAHWLNVTRLATEASSGARPVKAMTGDIGLHVGLQAGADGQVRPSIRCTYCSHNNELVSRRGGDANYHEPDLVLEIPVKRLGAAMVYLCMARGHYPGGDPDHPKYFLNLPEIRGM